MLHSEHKKEKPGVCVSWFFFWARAVQPLAHVEHNYMCHDSRYEADYVCHNAHLLLLPGIERQQKDYITIFYKFQ